MPKKTVHNLDISAYDNVTSVSGFNRLGIEAIANKKNSNGSASPVYMGAWKHVSVGDSFYGRIYSTFDMSNVNLENVIASQPNFFGGGMYIQGITGTNVSVSYPKIEIGNVATDWSSAPEDAPSNDAQLVHKTETETIAGDKTFTGNTTLATTTILAGNYGLRVTPSGFQKTTDGRTWVSANI
ncbi:hypothetical protein [Weissella confusa]|uniref:hypothetical protein n=1 Tax=Weissella confusa TaxID=1583 RepID=UPI0018F22F03|nr:hypothetical protein [Weissella confusa]MBJ7650425.1 hypothetical protein [Weissella confusa]